jgi:hypothetical protein
LTNAPECREKRVLGSSPYSAPETRQHVLVINTAFG